MPEDQSNPRRTGGTSEAGPGRGQGSAATDRDSEVQIGWRMAGVGFQVATEVAGGVVLGLLFDWWRGHGNIGVIVGSIAGLGVAMWSLISQSLKLNRELERKHPTKGRGKPISDEEWDHWDENDDEDRDN